MVKCQVEMEQDLQAADAEAAVAVGLVFLIVMELAVVLIAGK